MSTKETEKSLLFASKETLTKSDAGLGNTFIAIVSISFKPATPVLNTFCSLSPNVPPDAKVAPDASTIVYAPSP